MCNRRDVLGVPFDLVDHAEAMETIESWRSRGMHQFVTCTPPYSVMMCASDPGLAAATKQAGLVLPDGVGIILATKILGYESKGRVTGPALMLNACDWGRDKGYRHYFYGGRAGVPEALAERLSQKFPGLRVAGTHSPPFRSLRSEEDEEIVTQINATEPDIVWVGLGSPKQEVWMREHVGRICAAAMIGVGAAFDYHSGRVRWAPRLFRRLGFEWAYRLLHEPKRLWGRTAAAPKFILEVARQRSAMRQEVSRLAGRPTDDE